MTRPRAGSTPTWPCSARTVRHLSASSFYAALALFGGSTILEWSAYISEVSFSSGLSLLSASYGTIALGKSAPQIERKSFTMNQTLSLSRSMEITCRASSSPPASTAASTSAKSISWFYRQKVWSYSEKERGKIKCKLWIEQNTSAGKQLADQTSESGECSRTTW